MLATKLDLLIKCLDTRAIEKEAMYGTVQALDSHMTCEVCGNTRHLGNDCTETHEGVLYMNNKNNGFRLQGGQGWNNRCAHNTREVILILIPTF
jgi:hypothetical protein